MQQKKRILIIENDLDMLFLLEKALISEGYIVECCKGGATVVDYKHTWPDLFILDKDLPAIDGIALSKFLRLHKATKEIPIIMISAYRIKAKAKKAGIDKFIHKPFELSYLLNIVDKYVHNDQELVIAKS